MKKTSAFILVLLACVAARAATLTVCASGCDYTTISTAEAAASANDIIEIRDSRTYDETFTPSKTLTLRNRAGDAPTLEQTQNNQNTIDLSSLPTSSSVTVISPDMGLTVIGTGKSAVSVTGADGNIVLNYVFIKSNRTYQPCLNLSQSANFTNPNEIISCIVDMNGRAGAMAISASNMATPQIHLKIHNSLIRNMGSTGAPRMIYFSGAQTATGMEIINSTLDSAVTQIYSDEKVDMKNVLMTNFSTLNVAFVSPAVKTDIQYSGIEQTDITGYGTGSITVNSAEEYVTDGSDFHLKAGARSINAGTDTSSYGVTTDLDGISRPQGAAYDIGAYEYVSPASPTPTFTWDGMSETATPTASPSATPTWTPTDTRTDTRTATLTSTPTWTLTDTKTDTPTASPTATPTWTLTSTNTWTKTDTRTATPTATASATPTWTKTDTKTNTETATPTWTSTSTPTITATATPTPRYQDFKRLYWRGN